MSRDYRLFLLSVSLFALDYTGYCRTRKGLFVLSLLVFSPQGFVSLSQCFWGCGMG